MIGSFKLRADDFIYCLVNARGDGDLRKMNVILRLPEQINGH